MFPNGAATFCLSFLGSDITYSYMVPSILCCDEDLGFGAVHNGVLNLTVSSESRERASLASHSDSTHPWREKCILLLRCAHAAFPNGCTGFPSQRVQAGRHSPFSPALAVTHLSQRRHLDMSDIIALRGFNLHSINNV